MNFCGACGAPVAPAGARFCTVCGAALSAPAPAPAPAPATPRTSSPPPPPPPMLPPLKAAKKTNTGAMVGGFLSLVIMTGGVTVLLMR